MNRSELLKHLASTGRQVASIELPKLRGSLWLPASFRVERMIDDDLVCRVLERLIDIVQPMARSDVIH
jgi:hypothetical protein